MTINFRGYVFDDSGGTRNYYVDVVSATGVEFTGLDERGFSTISVMEP